jgi:hypothetical protein
MLNVLGYRSFLVILDIKWQWLIAISSIGLFLNLSASEV